jgi:lipid II:glycine glycyltransferase (peptidoglycan interpeptide bridge formation enzyme)
MWENRDENGWKLIPSTDLDRWNSFLMKTDTDLFQYPAWNESFRRMYFSPQYLTYEEGGKKIGYVCILSFGVPWLRIGIINRGPVVLNADVFLIKQACDDLLRWARGNGYIFLRLTSQDHNVLTRFDSVKNAEKVDAFPFYRSGCEELIVEQVDDEEEMLRRFQAVARRNIKKAVQVGYEIKADNSPDFFEEIWPLFTKLATRKQLQYRPLNSYLDIIEKARHWGGVGIYAAYRDGIPVQAILVLRDRTTAHYISGALDIESMRNEVSPSCLIHWTAMRDFFKRGVKYYSLGTRSGPVYQFKRKFRPTEKIIPAALTLITRKPLYLLWKATILRMNLNTFAKIKRRIFR